MALLGSKVLKASYSKDFIKMGRKMADNDAIYFSRLHWILFFWPVVMACLAMIIGLQVTQLKEVALLFLIFAIIWVLITWVNYHFSSLTIKKKTSNSTNGNVSEANHRYSFGKN